MSRNGVEEKTMKILVIESSPRDQESLSRKLTREVVAKLCLVYPGSDVKVRDLTEAPFPHLSNSEIVAFFTQPEQRNLDQKNTIKLSDEAIDELIAANILVIGAPIWNFSIPSGLKSWIDHIVRPGRTVAFGADGPKGLATGKKVFVASASAGVYSTGPARERNFQEPYLRLILGFIGITDVTFFCAEGASIGDQKAQEAALAKAKQEVQRVLCQ